jgi:2'-5' RNA ligase
MRCFVAIELPEHVKHELAKLQKLLPVSKSKLVEQHNLHLTLFFLAELTDFQVNQCKDVLKKINFNQFMARTGTLGVFPSENFIRVVWISLEPSSILKELHDKIYEEIKKLNLIKKLDKRFESHITLARVKFIEDRKAFLEQLRKINFRSLEFKVSGFVLKKSTLTKKGPIYEDIVRIDFKS